MQGENLTAKYDLTIVIPVYNEEDNIARIGDTLGSYLTHCSVKACVLLVDDGSRDDSLPRIKHLCETNSDFYYIAFQSNRGLSAAIKAGFDTVQSRLVGYMDADLQTSPEDFELLLPHTDKFALVTGIRVGRKDTWFKKIQSKIANGFRRMMTGDGALDTGCPLKILHSDVARRIPMFKGMHRFLPALVLLQEKPYRQIPVRHFARLAGQTKFSIWNRLIGPTADCFGYRWMRNRWYNYTIADSKI